MPATITHLVIGESVFTHLGEFDSADYGAFLLGCVLVDVHCCSHIDRRTAHFSERFDKDGANAFDRSCANFLAQLDSLLVRPRERLASAERAFITGYLCHLAADEEWKRFDVEVMDTLGIRWWVDLSVPVSVIMSAFEVLSSELYRDSAAVSSALDSVSVPEVLTHVSHDVFQAMWNTIKTHAMDGSTLESWFKILGGLGKTTAEIRAERRKNGEYWEDAEALIDDFFGGVRPRVQAMVQRSLQTLPRLWERFPVVR